MDYINYVKQSPIAGFMGYGGGATGLAVGGSAGPAGIEATGGIINDWQDPTSPTVYYRSHTFLNSGTFEIESVSTAPTVPDAADILIVGGGGARVRWSPGGVAYRGTKGGTTSLSPTIGVTGGGFGGGGSSSPHVGGGEGGSGGGSANNAQPGGEGNTPAFNSQGNDGATGTGAGTNPTMSSGGGGGHGSRVGR